MPAIPTPSARFGSALIIIALPLALFASLSARTDEPSAARPAKPVRPPWTTSRVVGSPEPPPPFQVVRAFPNLKFEHPLLLARAPGLSWFFVGEQAGVLYSFPDRPDAKADLFLDLRKELKTVHLNPGAQDVEAVYGLAFHPRFAQNRQCFVCYTLRGKAPGQQNLTDGTRISRFTVTRTDPPRADPASEEIVLTFLQGGHNGGDLHFGPDGMLYISTGDGASPSPPDPRDTGQDISDLLSSILRIDVDHKDPGKNYAVPKDNPFVTTKGARPEVWAYGLRNPWRMSFDRQTGDLWVGDVGWELWESVHRIEKGGNYGWSAMEGPQPIKPGKVGPTPILPPVIELSHTIAASVTGGYVYRGKKFPELRGAYVFGDWETRRLWAARIANDRATAMPEIVRPSVRVVAFGEDEAGELYFLDYDMGTVHTLERNTTTARNAHFPTKLSETGLFASVREQVPAAGVVPFVVAARQWQDGATAQYWAAFPGTSAATLYATGRPIPGAVDWHNFRMHFPAGAVLVRTLSLAGRRVETQLLHFDGVDWHGYSFAWRDDQADADLVAADGTEKELTTPDQTMPSGRREVTWQFHSRAQCLSCHNVWSESALAFSAEQLNRPGPDGRNQLVALAELGLLRRADGNGRALPPFDDASAAREPALGDPLDPRRPLAARARAYLHANCGHCHRFGGGGTVALELHFEAKLAQMQAIGVRPVRGDFGLPGACIIKPGDPLASTLYFRMAKFGRDRMPHLGSDWPDESALDLIARWIASMKGGSATPARLSGPLDQWLSSPGRAALAARKVGRGELSSRDRQRLLAAAAKLPAGPTRDLFEGYLPRPPAALRKLGPNPHPTKILAMKGDARRGEALFWSEAVKCSTCHKIGARGASVGPDLSTIGRQRTRPDLLESILEPSRRIEPRYSSYVLRTTDGRLLTGLLVARDERRVTIRDAQGKDNTLTVGEVEELRPSRVSLMPQGAIADLTAQEAADLLEFLVTRK